jgi:hypothetical protein
MSVVVEMPEANSNLMRKELNSGVAGRGVLSHYNKRLSIIQVAATTRLKFSELIS